jgi:hypothetical protein
LMRSRSISLSPTLLREGERRFVTRADIICFA